MGTPGSVSVRTRRSRARRPLCSAAGAAALAWSTHKSLSVLQSSSHTSSAVEGIWRSSRGAEREPFVSQLKEAIPFYGLRFAVKPGITGWAQVSYGYGANTEDARVKLEYELYSIRNMNPVLYLLILLKTVQTVLVRAGS